MIGIVNVPGFESRNIPKVRQIVQGVVCLPAIGDEAR